MQNSENFASTFQQLAEKVRALTVRQVADAAQVRTETVRTWIRNGDLMAAQLPGGQYRIPVSEVDRLLHRQGEVEP